MKIETIVSTMGREDINFYKKMNIQTPCLIINQAGRNSYEEKNLPFGKVRMLTTDTKGVGRSRDLGLINSDADIIITCDDDEVLEDGYPEMVEKEFKDKPRVDFFVFKAIIYKDGKETVKVKEEKNLKTYNCQRYGAVHYAFKRNSILKKNIFFSLVFGGGTDIGSGEDTIFITEAIRRGLKVRTSKKLLCKVYNDKSSRFTGYDEKFFIDKGKLARYLYPKSYRLYIFQFVARHPEFFDKIDKKQAKKLMIEGGKEFGGKNEKI